MKKNILFAGLKFSGMTDMFVDNLIASGYDVVDVSVTRDYKITGFLDKVCCLLYSVFRYNRGSFKSKMYLKYKQRELEQINNLLNEKFDYLFVLRPDIYPIGYLNKMISCSDKSIAYQWDGLDRFPEVFPLINLFDKFFVFDVNDVNKYSEKYKNLQLTTNFYSELPVRSTENSSNVYYLGSYKKSRLNEVYDLCRKFKELSIQDVNIVLNVRGKKIKSIDNQVRFVSENCSYNDYFQIASEAKVLLDFKLKAHNGLSFRFFEAMRFRAKVITTNKSVVNYEFYHSSNIFVIGVDSWDTINLFMDKEFVSLSCFDKYSFSNWFNNLMIE